MGTRTGTNNRATKVCQCCFSLSSESVSVRYAREASLLMMIFFHFNYFFKCWAVDPASTPETATKQVVFTWWNVRPLSFLASYWPVLCNTWLRLVCTGYNYGPGTTISPVLYQISSYQHCETVCIIFSRVLPLSVVWVVQCLSTPGVRVDCCSSPECCFSCFMARSVECLVTSSVRVSVTCHLNLAPSTVSATSVCQK